MIDKKAPLKNEKRVISLAVVLAIFLLILIFILVHLFIQSSKLNKFKIIDLEELPPNVVSMIKSIEANNYTTEITKQKDSMYSGERYWCKVSDGTEFSIFLYKTIIDLEQTVKTISLDGSTITKDLGNGKVEIIKVDWAYPVKFYTSKSTEEPFMIILGTLNENIISSVLEYSNTSFAG